MGRDVWLVGVASLLMTLGDQDAPLDDIPFAHGDPESKVGQFGVDAVLAGGQRFPPPIHLPYNNMSVLKRGWECVGALPWQRRLYERVHGRWSASSSTLPAAYLVGTNDA